MLLAAPKRGPYNEYGGNEYGDKLGCPSGKLAREDAASDGGRRDGLEYG